MIKKNIIAFIIYTLFNFTANAQLATVYIVDNKKTTVYHTNPQCKQLLNAEKPIIEISIQNAQSKYRECHFCKNQKIKKKSIIKKTKNQNQKRNQEIKNEGYLYLSINFFTSQYESS